MNSSLQVFQVRECRTLEYQVPIEDIFDVLPDAPQMVSVALNKIVWTTVTGATSYKLQVRATGNSFVDLWTLDAQVGATQVKEWAPFPDFVPPYAPANAYYRVIATTAVGDSIPSAPMFLPYSGSMEATGFGPLEVGVEMVNFPLTSLNTLAVLLGSEISYNIGELGYQLPPGLFMSVDVSGSFIFGTPTQAGEFPIKLRGDDWNGQILRKEFTVTVDAAPSVCLEFSDLVWGTPSLYTDTDCTAETLNAGKDINMSSSNPALFLDEAYSQEGSVYQVGTITLPAGPAFTASVAGTFTSTQPDTHLASYTSQASRLDIEIVLDGAFSLLDAKLLATGSPQAFSYAFFVPELLVPTVLTINAGVVSSGSGDYESNLNALSNNVTAQVCGASVLVGDGPPDAPVATAMTNVTTSSFEANWGYVPNATSYNFDVALDAAFTSPVAPFTDYGAGDTNIFTVLGGLTPGVEYFFRVRAVSAFGASADSNVVSATLLV